MKVQLPNQSIGGYGSILRELDDLELMQRHAQHAQKVAQLKAELSGEIQRLDLARHEQADRRDRKASAAAEDRVGPIGPVKSRRGAI